MEFEDILEDIGSFGLYQKYLVWLYTVPISILGPFLSMALIFVVTVPDHWCKIPDVLSMNSSIQEQMSLIRVSENTQCFMYDLNYTEYLTGSVVITNDTKTISCMNGWEYDKTDFEATSATQWDMVCDKGHFPSLILTLNIMGSLILTPIYGSIADRFGRKPVFFFVVSVAAVTEISSIMTSNFIIFAVMKTISGGATAGLINIPTILVSELVHPSKRVFVNGIINTFWTIGMCFLALVMYLCRSWITLGILNTVIGFSMLLIYWRFLPESPVWLVSRERYKEALNIMILMGKKNNANPDARKLLEKLKTLGEKIKKKKEEETHHVCLYVTKYPRFRRTFIITTLCWMANTSTYIGLTYNVMELEGNEFLNFFLMAIVEGPGNFFFWYSMEKMGRRWSASMGFMITAIICILPIMGLKYIEIISSVLGKCIISGVFMVTAQQCTELYPTAFRSSGIGFSKTVAKGTTLLIPYIIYLGRYGKYIPFVFLTFLNVVACILSAFLPESLDENLPQNLSDAEEFGKTQKFFSFNRKKKPMNDLPITGTCENGTNNIEKQQNQEIYAIKITESENNCK